MVKALYYIHKRRIVYRDLKPENIVIKNGVYKLCDLGWAVEISNKKFRCMKAGTFTYAPPESLLNQLQSYKSDIWTLGVLLHELLLKYEPFKAKNEID
jgi:serine/threonine protein kinase